jgi:hypothetical protein
MTERALAIDTDALDKIGLEVDMRLTDVWSMLFERGEELDTEFLGWLLRLAYVTGYWDALSEGERGTLCRQLGYPVPERRRDPAAAVAAANAAAASRVDD